VEIHLYQNDEASLAAHDADSEKRIRIIDIKKAVAADFGVSVDELCWPASVSGAKNPRLVRPRQVAMYLAKELLRWNLPKVGNKFGGRDTTTAWHSIKMMKAEAKRYYIARQRARRAGHALPAENPENLFIAAKRIKQILRTPGASDTVRPSPSPDLALVRRRLDGLTEFIGQRNDYLTACQIKTADLRQMDEKKFPAARAKRLVIYTAIRRLDYTIEDIDTYFGITDAKLVRGLLEGIDARVKRGNGIQALINAYAEEAGMYRRPTPLQVKGEKLVRVDAGIDCRCG